MSDEYVSVTSRSWFSRVGGSIAGVFFGFALFIAAFPLLWWNEGRAVRTHRSLEEGAGAVVPVSPHRVEATNQGKLVHVSGRATTTEVLVDPLFKVSANALRLRRDVEMYQWVEHTRTEKRQKLGGSEETITTYSYDKQWRSGAINSSSFKVPQGHHNPGSMKYESATFSASVVTLGAFTLNPTLRDKVDGFETVPATETALEESGLVPAAAARPAAPARTRKGKRQPRPAVIAAPARRSGLRVHGEGLYEGVDPASPAVGDLRITWRRVPPTEVSVIAQQAGASFRPYQTAAGNALQMLEKGTVGAAQMFEEAQDQNTLITWLLRVGGFLLMWLGLKTILAPLPVMASVVPFVGGIVGVGVGLFAFAVAAPLSLLTIAIAWILHRPLLAILLLVGAALGIVGITALVLRKRKAPPALVEPLRVAQ
jgi:hypothetical protein